MQIKRQAVMRALQCYSGSEKRWKQRSKNGRSREELKRDVSEELGIEGGGSMDWGWIWYKGGKNPRVTAKDHAWNILAEIKGEELLDIARLAFRIGRSGDDEEDVTI